MGEQRLRVVLVHARRRGEDPGADERGVAEFEQALQGSVLPELAVEDGEEDVDGLQLGVAARSIAVDERGSGGGDPRDDLGAVVGDLGHVLRVEAHALPVLDDAPHPGLRDPDRQDPVGLVVDGADHPGGRDAADGVLARSSSEENCDEGPVIGV